MTAIAGGRGCQRRRGVAMLLRPGRLAVFLIALSLIAHSRPTEAQWRVNGLPVCTAESLQDSPGLIVDCEGNAIVSWRDIRSSSYIYAQGVNADGVVQWTADGVPLASGRPIQWDPQLVSDGAGGAIVTFVGFAPPFFRIFAQRVNGDGVPQWGAEGVMLSGRPGYFPQLISDGEGVSTPIEK